MHSSASTDARHAAIAANNRIGIAAMIGAMGCFIVNDALIKYVSQSMASGQLLFLRGIAASLLVLLAAHALGATRHLARVTERPVLLRAGVDGIGSVLYVVSVMHLPLANATSINMASPLFITVLAAIFYGDAVGRARWIAIGVGFAGVLLIVRPQADGFNAFSLVCLVGTLLHSLRDLMTRRIHAGVPSILITLTTIVAVMLVSAALSATQVWQPIRAADLALLGVAAAFMASGYFLVVTSMRRGEMSLIAPFRYSALLFALALGFVVWGDVPDAVAACGIVLLFASGVYIVRASRRARAALPPLD